MRQARARRRRLSGESRHLSLHVHKVSRALSRSLFAAHTLFKDGCTALNLAAGRGHVKTVQMLLAVPGIDVHLGDKVTRTPDPTPNPPAHPRLLHPPEGQGALTAQ